MSQRLDLLILSFNIKNLLVFDCCFIKFRLIIEFIKIKGLYALFLSFFLDLENYIRHDEVVCNRVNLAIFLVGISSPKIYLGGKKNVWKSNIDDYCFICFVWNYIYGLFYL